MSTPTKEKRILEFLSLSLLLGLGAAAAALIFFSWLTDQVFEGDAVQFDEATRAAVHQLASPAMTVIMRFFSFVGSTLMLTILTAIVIIWFATQRWGREAKLFAITMIGGSLLNMTLKLTFKRSRPIPFFDPWPPETYSFPSGHSLMSACFFGALAAILNARIKKRRLRVIMWVLATLMFLAVGFSRIYLGVHHTTDVIAGFAAALIWIQVVRFVEMQLKRRRERKRLAADLRG
ncbi:MAG TPA: phosphatase PAP2 family protein [Pyrinomonadaceae bacterium]|nr:phosphatase PAP2 family protein [Pyrinomonadaceae bacterium]